MIASLRACISAHLDALALRDDDSACNVRFSALGVGSVRLSALVLMLHLAGLAAFWRYYHQPLWLAVPTLALLLALPILAGRGRGGVSPPVTQGGVSPPVIQGGQTPPLPRRALAVETLAPLFFLYAILFARVIAVRVLLANEPYADEASFADPRFIFFQIEAATFAALGYTAIVQVVRLTRDVVRTRALVGLALVLGLAAFGWFGLETIGHRTRGVTATDPYAYAQMAVDLATRGTLLHAYPLFPYVVNLNVSWYPIEHIGYRLFDNLTGSVPTVWPAGGSAWLGLMYRFLGEEGLYLATPLAALASLLALAWLAWEYFDDQPIALRAAIAAIAVALLATSWEQVDRSIVPLVDAQAQLFTTLAIVFPIAYAKGRERTRNIAKYRAPSRPFAFFRDLSCPFALFAGFALGMAYEIRHTQVLVAIPIVIAAWRLPWRERVRFLGVAGAAALVVALPDLWYHHQYLGSWLAPESQELALFGANNIWSSAKLLAERFFAGNEFGYLIPFLLYGIYRAARDNVWKFAVLAAWILVLGGFHLLYEAVKIRDLLPEYPAVILLTAYGAVALARDVRPHSSSPGPLSPLPPFLFREGGRGVRSVVVALAIFLAFLLPAMRDRLTILRPFQPVKVTFGYVTAAQRASFDQIAALTPPNAIIGSTMNDGAIDLYAGRATFRPGAWNADECARFVEVMRRENRPLYLLDDGAETSAARRALAAHYTLRRVAVLDVPLFGVVDDTPGTLWQVTAN